MNSIIKRCSVAGVLALAVLMPDFRLLKTSPEGLALTADEIQARFDSARAAIAKATGGQA